MTAGVRARGVDVLGTTECDQASSVAAFAARGAVPQAAIVIRITLGRCRAAQIDHAAAAIDGRHAAAAGLCRATHPDTAAISEPPAPLRPPLFTEPAAPELPPESAPASLWGPSS
jgi:hypothetical protein